MRCIYLFLLLPFHLLAQGPKVISINPQNMAGAIPATQNIEIQFDAPLNPSSVSKASVRIFGRWSGTAEGTYLLEDNGQRIVFTPDKPFFAGELVTVSVTKKLRSAAEAPIEKGYFWQFVIKTAHGSLKLNQIKVIPLRLPSETWIETYGAYAGDLNHDGYSDLTTVNEHSDDLRILLNDGAGQFPSINAPITMGTATASPNEAGDFDNDGETDLVVTTAHHNETRVLFGDGQGGFPHMDKYTTGNATRAVAVVDFDFDGDDDILTANRVDGTMNRLENQGDGTFIVDTFNPAGDGESALALADANNDGIADFFLGLYVSQKIALYLGDGEGHFTFSAEKPVSGTPWMMCPGDFNGDGFADAASANAETDKTVVIFGDGQGGLSTPLNLIATDHDFPLAVDAGDLDGDGDLDLVTSSYNSNNFTVFENSGAGQFTQVDVLPSASHASCAVLHDRDNDGDLDMTATDEGDDVLILFNNPGSLASHEPNAFPATFRIFPNPSSEAVFAEIELKNPGAVHFEVVDFSGKKLMAMRTGHLPAGRSTLMIFKDLKTAKQACKIQMKLDNGQGCGAIMLRH